MIGRNLVKPLTNLQIANFGKNVCTNINFEMNPDKNNKLTEEFSRKCAVDCSKAYSAWTNAVQEMANEIRSLNRDMMNNGIEKQLLMFDCENKSY